MILLTPLLTLLLPLTSATPTPLPQGSPTSTNILKYVDSLDPAQTSDKCSAIVANYGDDPVLTYPNAKIVHQPSGTISCQTRLRIAPEPGWKFSVTWVTLAGYLYLEPGALIERVNVSVGYYPGEGQADVATARNLYGRGATGYDGRFNLSIPVVAGGSDGKLGTTGCRTSGGDSRTWLTAYVFVSLVHEMVGFDDNAPHYGTVGGDSPDKELMVEFEGVWEKC